jgi:hypothetical protein
LLGVAKVRGSREAAELDWNRNLLLPACGDDSGLSGDDWPSGSRHAELLAVELVDPAACQPISEGFAARTGLAPSAALIDRTKAVAARRAKWRVANIGRSLGEAVILV